MKAAIVTFIRAYNHGAVLQAYALQKKLKDIGIDNEMLDYSPDYFSKLYSHHSSRKVRYLPSYTLKRWVRCFFPFSPIKQWVKHFFTFFILNKRVKGFEKFIQNNIRLSKKQYYSREQLNCESLDYDSYICGSDQVWHYLWTDFDPTYFLDFTSANISKKMSYAASFGFDSIPESMRTEYAKRLSRWDKYSVREETGRIILKQLINEEATQCCDPTLLLKKEEWDSVRYKGTEYSRYILVYYVNSCEKVLRIAKRIAELKKMRIISITSIQSYADLNGKKAKEYGAKHIGECSPDRFLSLFANAEYVITDSFHGTIFSLVYHKKFIVINKNVRVLDLLKVVGINLSEFEDDLSNIDYENDWSNIDRRLSEYRIESIKYLKTLK